MSQRQSFAASGSKLRVPTLHPALPAKSTTCDTQEHGPDAVSQEDRRAVSGRKTGGNGELSQEMHDGIDTCGGKAPRRHFDLPVQRMLGWQSGHEFGFPVGKEVEKE
ncbi:hypothetical protein RRG08_002998 [Elysia crispata]|uniref:Uncharacterized protein n=1 Tax=Elysia crispata TaxID=231223 RepID=A0AAE0ZVI3_9GAST|nr:hypothetical protein RRG08_002998 [Elysia crispata]